MKGQPLNSRGGIGGAIVAVIFGLIAWLMPGVPSPPPGLEGALTIVVAFIISQFTGNDRNDNS